MDIQDKYEALIDFGADGVRCRHRQLGREVDVHRLSFAGLADSENQELLSTLSRMAALDHPSIPHLIDVEKAEDAYLLILESTAPPDMGVSPAGDFLEGISRYSDTIDALSHAAKHGLAHGDLSEDAIRTDAHGNTTLTGIGLRQCHRNANIQSLAAHDLQQLRDMITAFVHSIPLASDDETLEQVEAIQKVVDRHRRLGGDVCRLNVDLKRWIHAAVAAREAKKLAFDASEDDESPGPTRISAIAIGAAGFCLVVIVLLAFFFRPGPPPQVTKSTAVTPSASTRIVQPPAASPLENVGILNGASQDLEVLVGDPGMKPQTGKPAKEPVSKTVDPAEAPDQGPAKSMDRGADAKKAADLVEHDPDASPRRRGPERNPFENAGPFVPLPPLVETTATPLLQAALRDDDPVAIRLLGGIGAFKHGEFVVGPANARSWSILFHHRDESQQVAALSMEAGRLMFAWLPTAADFLASDHLSNVILELSSGRWKHGLVLRQPFSSPAIQVELERLRPYDIDIPNGPTLNDVFIEVLPDEAGLAEALPTNIAAAIDGQVRVGLDAGKQSKIVLQIESQLKSNRKLRISAMGRLTEDSRFVPIKPGAELRLRKDLLAAKLALKQMRGSVEKIKDSRRKRLVHAQIRKLSDDQQDLQAFAASFMAAKASRLQLRIYRQVDEYQIPLAVFANGVE